MREGMNTAYGFEQALVWLRGFRKITRANWNGKGMFIYLVEKGTETVGYFEATKPLESVLGFGAEVHVQPRIDMKFANGQIGIWTPTHEDILAKDWNVLV